MTKTIIIPLLVTFILVFGACKKDEPKSSDVALKSLLISINNSDYLFTNIVDTFKITLPAGSSVTSAFLKNIDIPEGAVSSPLTSGTISFINEIAKILITAQDGVTKKEYVIKICNMPFNTTQIISLSFSFNGLVCDATIINDTAYVIKPFDGQTILSDIKINDFSLADNATSKPTKGEMVSLVNNLGSVAITAQDNITTKTYFVKVKTLPIVKTYSSDVYLGIGLRDIIIANTDTVINISNVANIAHSFTFGTKIGTKTASNGKLAFTKADLDIPSNDGITFNLTTNGSNLEIVTYKMYEIHHWKDLQAIRFNTSGNYVLANDITLPQSGKEGLPSTGFEPIGTNILQFTGKFNGNNKTINNLYINKGSDYAGLFSYLGSSSQINNLIINYNSTGCTGQQWTGGLAGYNEGTVKNCAVTGKINGNGNSGGLVGLNKGIITNSYYSGTAEFWADYEGGLIGQNMGTITNCYSTGSLNCHNWTNGGLVGYNNNGTITNCFSSIQVTGRNITGGLIGKNSGSISNCFSLNSGIQRQSGSTDIIFYRIAGLNTNSLTSNKANKDMTVIGSTRTSTDSNSLDGADLDTSNLTQSDFENLGWDFNTIWLWDQTNKLPKIR